MKIHASKKSCVPFISINKTIAEIARAAAARSISVDEILFCDASRFRLLRTNNASILSCCSDDGHSRCTGASRRFFSCNVQVSMRKSLRCRVVSIVRFARDELQPYVAGRSCHLPRHDNTGARKKASPWECRGLRESGYNQQLD